MSPDRGPRTPAHGFIDRLTQGAVTPPTLEVARREVRHFLRRLSVLVAVLTGLVLSGGVALSVFEDVSYWHGVNWAFDTVATTGSLGHPDTVGGELTKVFLVVLGVGTMLYLLVTLAELFVAGHLSGLLEVRRMERKIAQLNGHYLICGFGRVGHQVARDLRAAQIPFVVIDQNPDVREAMQELDVLHVDGRASDDEVLIEAGIERARGVIACVDSDAENIFVTLTARELRPDIEIVARAAEEPSERKLLRAGANHVVSPYKASGHAMASYAITAGPAAEPVAEPASEQPG